MHHSYSGIQPTLPAPVKARKQSEASLPPPSASRSWAAGVLRAARLGPPSRCLPETRGQAPGEEASAQRLHPSFNGGVSTLAGTSRSPRCSRTLRKGQRCASCGSGGTALGEMGIYISIVLADTTD